MPDSQFYTGRGDDGYTSLLGPERVPKYDLRPEAYGTVDEAQAAIGLARASGCTPQTGQILLDIQRDLYTLMAELAAAGEENMAFSGRVTSEHLGQVEDWLAELETRVKLPKEFVIPGDSQPGAALHLARTVVRRAERHAVLLLHEAVLANDLVVHYLNRLSSLLYVLALAEEQQATGQGPTLAKD